MFNKFKSDKNKSIPSPEEQTGEAFESTDTLTPEVLPKKIINASQKPSIISEGATFEGNLVLEGALHLDGTFKGTIQVDKMTVGKNGKLDGKSKANVIVAFGEIKGEISCNELTLNSGASIDGIIHYSDIKIMPGASIAGQINRKKYQQ